jgi:hypothetical protein
VCGNRYRLVRWAGAVLRVTAVALVAVGAGTSLGCGEKKVETTREPEPTAALVTLDRSDGFSFDEHLVVLNSGKATVRFRYRPSEKRGTKDFTLSQTKLDDLRTALEEADFSSLDSRYSTSEGSEAVADAVTYAGRKVVADEETVERGDVPEGLANALSLLNELLDSKLENPRNS